MKQPAATPAALDPTVCVCACHQGKAVHPVPCQCRPCNFCMLPVKSDAIDAHLTRCAKIKRSS